YKLIILFIYLHKGARQICEDRAAAASAPIFTSIAEHSNWEPILSLPGDNFVTRAQLVDDDCIQDPKGFVLVHDTGGSWYSGSLLGGPYISELLTEKKSRVWTNTAHASGTSLYSSDAQTCFAFTDDQSGNSAGVGDTNRVDSRWLQDVTLNCDAE